LSAIDREAAVERLTLLEKMFEEDGGRGVEVADEIDDLIIALDYVETDEDETDDDRAMRVLRMQDYGWTR
jgi:hypothetical protein